MKKYVVYFQSPVGVGSQNSPVIYAPSKDVALIKFWSMPCSNHCTSVDSVCELNS